ncbi:MAG: type II toxin-antitoxin system VapC family toxin [Gemmataceae bacterium]|nr:type II toxin-antitoxin system VapC family toxin [Gemmataceae bacterium]
MAGYFVDSSALVKRYVAEIGSSWMQRVTATGSGSVCFVASVTAVEVQAAVYRRFRMGLIDRALADSLAIAARREFQNQFRHITVQSPILLEAIDLVSKHPLRAYDAIQLSAALYLQRVRVPMSLSRLTFLSADKVLNQAALAEGLLVDDPNDHP